MSFFCQKEQFDWDMLGFDFDIDMNLFGETNNEKESKCEKTNETFLSDDKLNKNNIQQQKQKSPGKLTKIKDKLFQKNKQEKTIKKRRRLRPEEIEYLTVYFEKCPRPSTKERYDIGFFLRMSSRKVQIWFQNKRAKEKREKEENNQRKIFSPIKTPKKI